ncbi:hypothetical protein GUJ93_ZPchr0010g8500 [Zizania palustris]|uniref:N-acetylglucosamine kinase n=1 Tax=Zizania palustris TaxID=103762 RepID=A0A8J5WEE3_ZIZPA|nr:hypothetical protein GUJ93_ZPchr0010g8500 [Zizania palustris]
MPPPESPRAVPVLSRAVAGCSNRNSVGESAALETLEQVMTQALIMANTDRSAVRAVCLAVSGVNHPSDQQRMLDWIQDLFPVHAKFYVENDAVAALASWYNGKSSCWCWDLFWATGVVDMALLHRPDSSNELIGWTYADPSWAPNCSTCSCGGSNTVDCAATVCVLFSSTNSKVSIPFDLRWNQQLVQHYSLGAITAMDRNWKTEVDF